MDRFDNFIDKLINDVPEFMKIEEDGEIYLFIDYLINNLNDKAMSWLFKVYLDKKFNIIVEDKLTEYIKVKYDDENLKIVNVNGNLFLNKGAIRVILKELEISSEGEYNEEELTFSLK
ncbi:MAG: hypothetical protein RR765_07390 [Peptostreptococcaceae bacterium]